ncbi:hypothetical protein [Saccharibacillus sacchari]|uniref:Uncharacterized protein n=1 Tax=Saccharibacillus sacchari TaxID=456493 RepID=A0ACC6PJJ9_9BACL
MVDRKKRLKPWAAAAALASILLLGGCLRFGPQEDEMANTTNTETAQTEQPTESTDAQPAEEPESFGADEPADESANAAESGEAEPSSDTESTEDTASNASGDEKQTKDKDEGPRVEVTVSRDDYQQIVEFDLHVLPAGYSLSGMSWEPEIEESVDADPGDNEATETTTDNEGTTPADEATTGTDAELEDGTAPAAEPERIASTYLEAVIAGQAGTDGFFIDENGQRIGFRYAEDQTGRTGTVRLDFRDGDGGIATWEDRITLGLQEVTNPEEEAGGGEE